MRVKHLFQAGIKLVDWSHIKKPSDVDEDEEVSIDLVLLELEEHDAQPIEVSGDENEQNK